MPADMDFRKWIVAGLLVLHIGWIGNHMRLVAADQINPWRLGGYGMYTIPSPFPRLQVFDASMPDAPIPVNTVHYEAVLRSSNAARTFRCASIPSAALRSFFNENRNLFGKNLVFVYSERRFIHFPPSTKRELQGAVRVTWQDMQSFTYTSRFCGKEETGSVTLS